MRILQTFITLLLFAFIQIVSFAHHDQVEFLAFEYTNFDHGLQHANDKGLVCFPFYNPTDSIIIIDEIRSNNKRGYELYKVVNANKWINDTIFPGERDTLFYRRNKVYTTYPGRYDCSWTILFNNSPLEQGINIFCFLDLNKGKLSSPELVLPNVDRGEIIDFYQTVRNTGDDSVIIFKTSHWLLREMSLLDSLPITVPPNSDVKLHFQLATEGYPKNYTAQASFYTNEDGSYPRLRMRQKGELNGDDYPTMIFDSTVSTIHCNIGEAGVFFFPFTNTGKQPLIISSCKTSCGCLVASWPKEPIMSGESGVIRVKYDTKRIGPINKTVTVYTNASSQPFRLRVKGMVKNEGRMKIDFTKNK